MKNTILSAIVLMTLALNACTEKAKQQETATTPPVATTPDEIVASSVSNKDGQKIDMAFNNTKSTATMQLNGETIELKQDTTASGISYSNEHYKYVEHQGDIAITKDGKVIFQNKEIEATPKPTKLAKIAKPTIKAVAAKDWVLGKKFVMNAPVSARPEEGGVDFLTFNNAQSITLKRGDIAELMSASFENNKMILTGRQTGRKTTFTIKDNAYLLDEYGIKWTVSN